MCADAALRQSMLWVTDLVTDLNIHWPSCRSGPNAMQPSCVSGPNAMQPLATQLFVKQQLEGLKPEPIISR